MTTRTRIARSLPLALAACASLTLGCNLEDFFDLDELVQDVRETVRAGETGSPFASVELDENRDLVVTLAPVTPIEQLATLPQRETQAGRGALRTILNRGETAPKPAELEFGDFTRGDTRSLLDFEAPLRSFELSRSDAGEMRQLVVGRAIGRGAADSADDYADPGGEAIIRFSCCLNVWVRDEPQDDAAQVTRLDESEPVWLLSLINTWALTGGLGGGNVWAEVFVPEEGVTGWVPLAALLVDPVEAESGNVVLELGYRPISDALWERLDAAFRPEGCEDPEDSITVHASFGHKWWYPVLGEAYDCDDPHEALGNDCAACNETTLPGYQSPYDQCVASLPEGWQPKDHCQDASFAAPVCHNFVEDDTSKTFPNPRAWKCGEYPFGTTNWDDGDDADAAENNAEWKHLVWKSFWDQAHRFIMKRVEDQRSIEFETYDLTQQRTITRSIDNEIGPENIRVSFTPYGAYEDGAQGTLVSEPGVGTEMAYRLGVHVCGHMPGVRVAGPDTTYEPWKTHSNLFKRIDFGTMDFDRVDVCAAGSLALGEDWEPSFEWLEITEFEITGLNLGGTALVFAPWVYISMALGVVLMPAILGGIGAIVSAVIATALAASIALPIWINQTPSDQVLWDELVPETFKAKFLADVVVQLNDATQDALEGQVLGVKNRLADACDAAVPSVDADSPYYWFYRYLARQCQRATNDPTLAPFQANDSSDANGCYGLDALFEPPTPGANAWWRTYTGQSWYTGGGNDAGCRLGFELRQQLDPEVWPVLQCIAAQANTVANVPGSGSIAALVAANCQTAAANAVLALYGNGNDLLPLIDPEDEHPLVLEPPPPPEFEPGLKGEVPVIVEPPPDLGFGS